MLKRFKKSDSIVTSRFRAKFGNVAKNKTQSDDSNTPIPNPDQGIQQLQNSKDNTAVVEVDSPVGDFYCIKKNVFAGKNPETITDFQVFFLFMIKLIHCHIYLSILLWDVEYR